MKCIFSMEGRFSLGENNGETIWKEFVKILKENEISTTLLFDFFRTDRRVSKKRM